MPYPSAFFALMTHKSVPCAIFPNKPGVPTEKNQVHMYIFLETGSANFFLSHMSILRASSVLCVSTAQVSSFAPKFSLGARFQNLSLPLHPHPSHFRSISHPAPLLAAQTATAATTASTTSTFYPSLVDPVS